MKSKVVSILVLLDFVLKVEKAGFNPADYGLVSILVLLDFVLKESRYSLHPTEY